MAALACILLVDDDTTTNFLNQALLRRMAVADTLLVATNGREALALLRTHCAPEAGLPCPTLVLLDLKMPVMNGLEFLEAFTQQAFQQRPVIVMLTTSLNPQDVERLQSMPIADYLTKPLTREKVTALLAQHFPAFSLPA
jgi:CheY-like chemotaxis protein